MPELKCPHCDRTFKNGAGLHAHIRNSHKDIVAKKSTTPFQCNQCDKAFPTELGLGVHKKRSHGKPQKVKEPAVQVNFCPCCGFDLRLLTHAITALKGMSE